MGLKETLRLVTNVDHKNVMVFVLHDKEHDGISSQLMGACKQQALSHYVLPKFSKVELCKIFKVKHLTAFAIDFQRLPSSLKQSFETELSPFN